MSALTLIIFISLFLYVFLCDTIRLCVRLSLLSHEFEQFGLMYMCAPRKDIDRNRARYPRDLSPMNYPGAT